MRSSRGMGIMAKSKMPNEKMHRRKPERSKFKLYADGGSVNWIKGAIGKKGALHRSLGVKEGEKIPAGKLAAAAKKPGKLGQRARLAETLRKMH